jgi:predicted anti-sigma-YlaC factor YlaD
MDCGSAREAISALLDEEVLGVEREDLQAHLANCPECRLWREDAHRLTRRVRLAPAQPVPSPPESLFDALGASARPSPWPTSLTLTRLALMVVGVVQIAWVGVPTLIFGTDRGSPIHVAHEMGSFDVALAVGFLLAAWRPARAHGIRTLVGAAALLLVATAALDLALGRTTVADEAPHLLAVAGWLLLRQLAGLMPTSETARSLSLSALRRSRGPMAPVTGLVDEGPAEPHAAASKLVA